MPFYKVSDSGELISSPKFVFHSDYTLEAEKKDTYTYPVDGWYWYDDYETAYAKLISNKSITRAQAKLALLEMGVLDTLEEFMSNPSTPRQYKIAWSDALTFSRTSATIAAVSSVLSLSEAQLDELFAIAASLDGF